MNFFLFITDNVLISLVSGVVTVAIAAIAAFTSRQAARAAKDALDQGEATSAKADSIIEKADVIHDLTNSNLSKVTSQLDLANEKIAGLQNMMAGILQEREQGTKTAQQVQLDQIQRSISTPSSSSAPELPTRDEPVPVVDDKLAAILTPKIEKLQDTLDEGKGTK